jgi:hypothetical protein
VYNVTGHDIGVEPNAQRTCSGVPAMGMAREKTIANTYAMFVNPFITNAVKTAQINNWWYEETSWIDPAQRNADPPCGYVSLVNEFSLRFFS